MKSLISLIVKILVIAGCFFLMACNSYIPCPVYGNGGGGSTNVVTGEYRKADQRINEANRKEKKAIRKLKRKLRRANNAPGGGY